MAKPPPDPATAYAQAVTSGHILTGELVRLACQRHLDDLAHGGRRGLRWNLDECERVWNWFDLYHHFKGRWAKGRCSCPGDFDGCERRIRWQPWQRFILGSLFGWQVRDDEAGWLRRFRTSYVQLARKNSKTTMGACVCVYMTGPDQEPSAEAYSAATKKDQARYSHDTAKGILRASPDLRPLFKGWAEKLGNIYVPETMSKFEPLSSDSNTLDGLSPHSALIDELHAHKSGDVRNVLESGMGARDQPLLHEWTTAGELWEGSVCKAERDYGEQILRCEVDDDSFFAYIAEPDAGDDWTSETAWQKANPNLGISIKLEELARQCEQAKANPIKRYEFKTKRCDLWQDVELGLFPMEAWRDCPEYDHAQLAGRECFGGLDLAEATDMTAFALVFPPRPGIEEPWVARLWYWLPAQTVASRSLELRPVRGWVEAGFVRVAGEVLLDYRAVIATILEQGGVYNLREVGFDPYKARQMALKLQEQGVPVVEIRQGHKTLSEATTKFVDLVAARNFSHNDNPVLTWNAAGAKGRTDANLNIVPDKQKSRNRIDGISAVVNALSRALAAPAHRESIYATRAPVVR